MIELAPSILAADFARLGDQVARAQAGGADLFHLDIMDGHFVPNLTFGPDVARAVAQSSPLPCEAHLMIDQPERYAEEFIRAGARWVIVHPESKGDAAGALARIRALGARTGIALNPETPVAAARELIAEAELVLVMSVHPGFAGQKFMPEVLGKFAELQRLVRPGTILALDGGINRATIAQAVAAGATRLVAGSAVFGAADIAQAVRELRRAAETAAAP